LSEQDIGSGYCNFDRGKSRLVFVLIALFIASWSILLGFYTPEEIVAIPGVQNVYVFVFLLSIIVGVSVFTTTLFYTSLVAISLGGVNLAWISLLSSIGLLSGDLVIYYISRTGSQCIPEKYENYFVNFLCSILPLPSDSISIFLGVTSFPVRKMILPLVFGKFIMITVLLELAALGYSLF